MSSVVVCGRPVYAKIFKGESLFFAENEWLNIYATGETETEAIQAFSTHAAHFCRHYKNLDWGRTTGSARCLKQLYLDHFTDLPD